MTRPRLLAFLAVAIMLTVAGCLQPAAPGDSAPVGEPVGPNEEPAGPGGGEPAGGEPDAGSDSEQDAGAEPGKDAPSFCESEADCKFWDDQYHEYVLYEVDTVKVDVLIVPPASPFAIRDTATMRAVVDAWEAGIAELGAEWLTANFTINAYVLGQDTPPQDALSDPEIIVVGAEYNPALLFGIGYQLPDVCVNRGGAVATYPTHSHDGMRIYAEECAEGGLTCVALNTNFLMGGARRMYDLVAHEFGHCLGGGHVGDALDFRAKTVPVNDIMSYQYDETQVHCVSNLNVRVLEGVYAPLLDRPEAEWLAPDSFYTMDPAEYVQVKCENPGG